MKKIEQALKEKGIPVSVLTKTEAPTLEVKQRWYDNQHCPNGRVTNRWETDGQKTEVGRRILEEPRRLFRGGGIDDFIIEGASYAFCVDYGGNGSEWVQVSQIVVWPHCDPAALSSTLASIK